MKSYSCEFAAGGFRFRIRWTSSGVSGLEFAAAGGRRPRATRGRETPPAFIRDAIGKVRGYFGKGSEITGLKLDLSSLGTFDKKVLLALKGIPRGRVVSYGRLAEMAGVPTAARAVGGALARNPIPLILPCHRVVGRDRTLCGFSARGGIKTKERLLRIEGVAWEGGDTVSCASLLDKTPEGRGSAAQMRAKPA